MTPDQYEEKLQAEIENFIPKTNLPSTGAYRAGMERALALYQSITRDDGAAVSVDSEKPYKKETKLRKVLCFLGFHRICLREGLSWDTACIYCSEYIPLRHVG